SIDSQTSHTLIGFLDVSMVRDKRDLAWEGVEPPGNRSAVGHFSRSVTPAPVCASEETVLKLWSTMSAAQGGLFEEFRRLIGPGPAIPEGRLSFSPASQFELCFKTY